MKDLSETVTYMCSDDYKERFLAEYWQTKIRYEKLKKLNYEISAADITGRERPKLTCPVDILQRQQREMRGYLEILELRAVIEGVKL